MIIVFISNFIVGLSGYLVAARFLQIKTQVDFLISVFILYLSQIILTELLLGVFGILNLTNLILFNLLILVFVLILSRSKKARIDLSLFKRAAQDLLNNKVILICVSLIIGFGIVKLFINLIYAPFGWDNLSYHFVFPVEWLKHANLENPITLCDDPSPSYYPINGSLFFLWWMLPLKNVFLADLAQTPFFILAVLSIYSICRKLRLNREFSFYAAALFLITPNVFKQLEIAYVDVMVAGLFLTGLNFLLSLKEDFNWQNLLLWSVSFGLFLGTKTSAVIYGVFLFIYFAYILFKQKNRFIYLILFLLVSLVLGGFSYIKSILLTLNPLYPADIYLFGKNIFKGVVPFSFYRDHWTLDDLNLGKFLFSEGLGGQFLIFVLPAIFLGVPVALIRKAKEINFTLIFILALPLLLIVSFLLFMPQFWVRYLYTFLAAGFIAGFLTVDSLRIPVKVVRVIVIVCFFASAGELSGSWEIAASFILAILTFFLLPKILRIKLNLSRILIFFVFCLVVLHLLNSFYDANEYNSYLKNTPFPHEDRQAWKWLNDNTPLTGSRIAYAGIPHVLPLYGTHFKNDVSYVSVNKVNPVCLHDFPNGKYYWFKDYMQFHKNLEKEGNYRENPDYNTWLGNLTSDKIDYLVVYSLRMSNKNIFPIEDLWANGHADRFQLVFNREKVHIFKVAQ
ncbi:MAG: hypothetical protein HY761_10775 [Candidatus Omnitrophica bacterium]|nr:hypothetical protein [Candidatus Omnitrophota bacterium]